MRDGSAKHITIAGALGSGKSSIAHRICETLHYKYFSTGNAQRILANSLGMNTLELNLHAETDPSIDEKIDGIFKDLNHAEESYIVDSRMAWYFLKNALNIYLMIDIRVAAQRVIDDMERKQEPAKGTLEEMMDSLRARRASEVKRFKNSYNVDIADLNNYDFIIDTTLPTVEQITNHLLAVLQMGNRRVQLPVHWVSPKMLFPLNVPADEPIESYTTTFELAPIDVIMNDGYYYIYEGYRRVAHAIEKGWGLVPIRVVASGEEEITPGQSVATFVGEQLSGNPSALQDWEATHSFQFYADPLKGL